VVESPRGSAVKLKYDPLLGAMSISRPLVLGLTYPYDWGFVPSTKGFDGDAIDAMVYWDVGTFPGVVIPCLAVAVLQVEQNGPSGVRVRNDRVIAVPVAARRSPIGESTGMPERVKVELEHFFVASTALESKELRVLGWGGGDAALALIRGAAA
jgi:inorganic pyrophosphatase